MDKFKLNHHPNLLAFANTLLNNQRNGVFSKIIRTSTPKYMLIIKRWK